MKKLFFLVLILLAPCVYAGRNDYRHHTPSYKPQGRRVIDRLEQHAKKVACEYAVQDSRTQKKQTQAIDCEYRVQKELLPPALALSGMQDKQLFVITGRSFLLWLLSKSTMNSSAIKLLCHS